MTGVRPTGHFLPALRSVFAAGPGAAFPASGGSRGRSRSHGSARSRHLSFLERFSLIFMVTSIGEPAKPNSSRMRRSMKRR